MRSLLVKTTDHLTFRICPTCRVETSGRIPNYFARDSVDELQVICPEVGVDNKDGNKKRKRDDDATNVVNGGCNWKGPLKDLIRHEENECDYKTVKCTVDGCGHTCLRKEEMESHLVSGQSFLTHIGLMKQSMEDKYEQKIKSVEVKYEGQMRHMKADFNNRMQSTGNDWNLKYNNELRKLMEQKPDALIDFSVQPIRKAIPPKLITGLLCYIPGPTGSDWEGAKIPMLLRFVEAHKPPRCKFPGGFFHPNIIYSGTICIDRIMEEEMWKTEMNLAEILFCVQQLLPHPNCKSPAQSEAYHVWRSGAETYQRRVKEEAQKYSIRRKMFCFENEVVDKNNVLDDGDIATGYEMVKPSAKKKSKPKPPSFPRGARKRVLYPNCDCSCCAWGQTLWDDKQRMRFLQNWCSYDLSNMNEGRP